MAETTRLADERTADRKTTERRLQYNTVRDNLKPGDVKSATKDKDTISLIQENEGAGQFDADPANPDNMIYRKHEAETAALKIKQQQEKDAVAEKRAAEQLKIQQEHLKIAQKDADNRDKAATRAEEIFTAKKAAADKLASQLSSAGKTEAEQTAKAQLDATEKSGSFFGKSPEEVRMMRANIVHQAYDDVLKKEQARSGKTPPSTLIQGSVYLTPEEMKAIPEFANLPPGAKVKRNQ